MSEIQNKFLQELYESNYDTPDFNLICDEDWTDFTDHLSITPVEAF